MALLKLNEIEMFLKTGHF